MVNLSNIMRVYKHFNRGGKIYQNEECVDKRAFRLFLVDGNKIRFPFCVIREGYFRITQAEQDKLDKFKEQINYIKEQISE